jgi:hypothetical protein
MVVVVTVDAACAEFAPVKVKALESKVTITIQPYLRLFIKSPEYLGASVKGE